MTRVFGFHKEHVKATFVPEVFVARMRSAQLGSRAEPTILTDYVDVSVKGSGFRGPEARGQ
ncbi:hypothetical protein EYF80_061775 [Liparis tanakae]|uniref:Uncharacterized protein n=1 Tax=Liparis tanakae TaxID=230148 RepID=A0A4Z2EH30_9TELE|nr:hypothetical protein EYF80_061775 [Liparis tanakae]